MENKISTRELYSQLQDKLIINLDENEIPCPECKGLHFVFVEKNNSGYIESCRRCYTGKLFVCKYCGTANKTDHCNCKEAQEERNNKFYCEQTKKDFDAYQKAEKIHYRDYDGKFILEDSEYVKDIDDVAEWIYEQISEGNDVPQYLWATESSPHFSIDLLDVISDKCEDGYEEMYEHLDTSSHLIVEAQELIEKWEKEQGDSLNIYYKDYTKAILIKDLVEEIKKEIEVERQ
jgi:hypothetical protein